jgi:hypothetical protein
MTKLGSSVNGPTCRIFVQYPRKHKSYHEKPSLVYGAFRGKLRSAPVNLAMVFGPYVRNLPKRIAFLMVSCTTICRYSHIPFCMEIGRQ